jgi:predicted ATP-dependent endonuclease of OLD family
MDLIWLKVKGYRRFKELSTLNLFGKMIALIGPNEAGKTSLLEALLKLTSDDKLAHLDSTRTNTDSDETSLEAAFFLEEDDRAVIRKLDDIKIPRWLYIKKLKDGKRQYRFDIQINRDKSYRVKLLGQLKRAKNHKSVHDTLEDIEEWETVVDNCITNIPISDENLNKQSLDELKKLSNQLRQFIPDKSPKFLKNLPDNIMLLHTVEAKIHPHNLVAEKLRDSLPSFVLFDHENRALSSSYDIKAVWENPPEALQNLVTVADLNLRDLFNAIERNDQAQVHTLQYNSNARLKKLFSENWSQSEVTASFRVDGYTLHLQILDKADQFSGLDERSDGLRQFVALLAFCITYENRNPILLIDEAESHLHYDAQADLINMLSKQQVSKKIIYTTHSMGCLPEDMGAGLRLIQSIENDTLSKITNKFWSNDKKGFHPLLYGIGATTLSFLPMRNAILVEGSSDHILLPIIFRAISKQDHIGFQIVPGLSETSKEQIPILENHGRQALFLLDNDSGGINLEKWLVSIGIPKKRIMHIVSSVTTKITVEDLLEPSLFEEGVNSYLRKWEKKVKEFRLQKNRNHAISLLSFCKSAKIEVPSKTEIAYVVIEILAQNPSRNVINRKYKRSINQTLKKISNYYKERSDTQLEPTGITSSN